MPHLLESEKRKELLVQTKLSDLTKCLRARASLLQTLSARDVKETNKNKAKRSYPEKTKAFHAEKIACALCKEGHHIQACEAFLKLDVQNRGKKVKALNICINCLRPGHFAKNCSSGSCKVCGAKHNTLLHFDRAKATTDQSNAQNTTTAAMCSTGSSDLRKETNVVLSTALIDVSGKNGLKKEAQAFLDSCSQSNFITQSLYKKLKLKQVSVNMQIGVLGQLGPNVNGRCEVEIASKQNGYRLKIQCLIVPQITDLMLSV